MPLIELKGIYKHYRQGGLLGGKQTVPVLKGVDLTLEAGKCLGLLGASGCGKSTTGRIVLGLEPPDAGTVFYRGKNITDLKGEEKQRWRKNTQVVFQNSHGAVNPRHPAWVIITEPVANFSPVKRLQRRDIAAALLERVGLSGTDLDKLPHQFSGGELQRVCIARALSVNPEFILLDEAVSALDMLSQSRILDLVMTLKAETGTAFLFISHDLRILLKISDALAIMDDGKITTAVADLSALEIPGSVPDPVFQSLAAAVLPAEPVVEGKTACFFSPIG